MQQLKALWITSLILIFSLVFFGCATSKKNASNCDFEITAEAVQEGILITFFNMPQDTAYMWVSVTSLEYEDTEEQNPPFYKQYSAFAGFSEPSVREWVNSTQELDKIKLTNMIILPFIKGGLNYTVTVIINNEQEFFEMRSNNNPNYYPRIANTEVFANNGIYFNRDDVKLDLNYTNSSVTLSKEPVFSTPIIFDEQKYSFGVTVHAGGGKSTGIGDHHFPEGLSSDGLTWRFEPYFTESLKDDDVAHEWLGDNSHPAICTVYANIYYDDIKWRVEIAKSPVFNYSRE